MHGEIVPLLPKRYEVFSKFLKREKEFFIKKLAVSASPQLLQAPSRPADVATMKDVEFPGQVNIPQAPSHRRD